MLIRWLLGEFITFALLFPRMLIANGLPTSDIRMFKVRYGEDPRQHLIFINPKDAAKRRDKLAVFIHGGGWKFGSPSLFRFVGYFFARRGYPVLLLGYRLAPRFQFPAQVDDVFEGLRAGLMAAAEHGVTTNRIIVSGQSAGAHLASFLVYDKRRLASSGIDQRLFEELVIVSGPVDFTEHTGLKLAENLARGFVGEASIDEVNPILLIEGDERVRVLVIHSDCDPLVELQAAKNFVDRINGGSGEDLARLVIIRDRYHSELLDMFLDNRELAAIVLDFVEGAGANAGRQSR